MIQQFEATYGLTNYILTPYGSRTYGTETPDSDYDYIAIVPENRKVITGIEYRWDKLNVHIYTVDDFQIQLENHKIHALEAYYLSEEIRNKFKLNLSLSVLRRELSQKSSNSFVKCKKKLEIEKDYYIGWKSLFHSLRILIFGIQIAKKGKIEDYSAANGYWHDIITAQQYNWEYFKVKYQPIYNELATEFRKVAPK